MTWQEKARWRPLQRADETSAAASIPDITIPPTSSSRKGEAERAGLAHEIASTSTDELREQVRLLSLYGEVFGMAGTRRRRLAVLELGRRMAVRNA